MDSEYVIVFCDDNMISSTEGILFEYPISPKVVTISENMLFDALRKTIMDVIRGCRILLNLFYCQPNYVGDGYVEYECVELKCEDDLGKLFFIFSKFSSKDPIELNSTFD